MADPGARTLPHPAPLAILLVLPVLLAGCQETAPSDFDGEAALDFAAGLVTADDGSPRYRVPGTPGHAEGATWLHGAMQVEGWTVAWQNFTGDEYEALPKGAVAAYAEPDRCGEGDPARFRNLTLSNLVATWNDPHPTGRTLLLGAHWDSKAEASHGIGRGTPIQGANDGASGVGVLLQLMHHVSAGDVEVPVGLRVAFFDAEDGFEDCHPLAGSIFMAANLAPGEVDRMVLLDMVGDPDARFVREQRSTQSDPELVDLLWRHGQAVRPSAFTDQAKPVLDDHIPFIEAGVAAVDLIDFGRPPGEGISGFPPYWHTTGDTLDKLDAAMLGDVGTVLVRTLEDPDLVTTWPEG